MKSSLSWTFKTPLDLSQLTWTLLYVREFDQVAVIWMRGLWHNFKSRKDEHHLFRQLLFQEQWIRWFGVWLLCTSEI